MRKREKTFFSVLVCTFLGLGFLFTSQAQAQDCGCNHVVEVNTTFLDGSKMGVKPGDVVCLKAGRRTNLLIKNFVGSSTNYITIKNCGGQVVLGGSTINNGIMVQNSRYFRLTGTGVAGMKYGIKIDQTKAGSQGVAISEFSSDVEVDHLEITGAGFAGIMAKTDPKCDNSADRGRFTMYNVKIHDNYIYNVVGEGIYLGNSFYNGTTVYCNTLKYPHEIKGVRVYNNIIRNSGWEGIQVGSATHDVEIYDNQVINYGQANKDSQNNGIQLGLGTTGKCYNNYIENGFGTGIVIQGIGNNRVYNNVIVGAGYPAFNVNVRPTPLTTDVVSKGFLGGIHIINNTIIDTKNSGAINEYINDAKDNTFYNNLVVTGSTNWRQLKTHTSWKVDKNVILKSAAEARFVNPSAKDYRIQSGSPAIDAGLDVSAMGITQDWDRKARKVGASTDAGISEFASATPTTTTVANKAPVVNAGADQSIQLPTNSTSINATASDSDGSIASYFWTKTSGPAAGMSGTTTNRLALSNLVEGSYTFRLTVKDDKGATATDDVVVTVKAATVANTQTTTTTTTTTTSGNQPPTVTACNDRTITLPTNSTLLTCVGKDTDGFITSYYWTKVSGPSVTMSTSHSANYTVSNLVAGTYVFRVTATDNNKATAFDDVTVTVVGTSTTTSTTTVEPVVTETTKVVTTEVANTTSGNLLPLVKASDDRTVVLPTNSTLLTCAGKDEDGFITSYRWAKVSGPSATLPTNHSANFHVTNLVEGTYVFRVTATDNNNGQSHDEVTVYVVKGTTSTTTANKAPIATAPSDKSLTLPTNSITLNGLGRDEDGTIAAFKWTKISGPSANLSGDNTANLSVTAMVEGSYTFRLTVTDNKGATGSDDVVVLVNKQPVTTTTTTTQAATTATVSSAPLYRINAGGTSNLSASPIQWDMDTKENPSRYLSTSSSNNTAGSNNWSGTNRTQAPNAVFGPVRFDFSWGGAMKYSFPVKNGSYEVRLYFAETPYSGGVKAAGERVFDIKVEGQTKVSNLDIFKEAGMNALQKTVVINVTDGNLDLDFVRKIGNPQINGIEILPATTSSTTMTAPSSSKNSLLEVAVVEESPMSVYPNPVVDRLTIRFGKELASDAIVQLINLSGVTLLNQTLNAKGLTEAGLDISHLNLPGGIYILKVQTAGAEQSIKIMKQ